jgi:hypothetical protein
MPSSNILTSKIQFKQYTYIGICIFTIIVLVILLALFRCNSANSATHINKTKQISKFINKSYTNIDYDIPALEHPTKSVDGENQFTPNSKWKAQPSKCFDCEAQLQAQCGDACVYNTTKQKVFNNYNVEIENYKL